MRWKKLPGNLPPRENNLPPREDNLPERGDCDDPDCPCHEFRRRRRERNVPERVCSLGQPLWMVIPPEGAHISCPAHGKHFVPGNDPARCSLPEGF
jgi:hypothetical protein